MVQKNCNAFVPGIDGERNAKMINLSGNYFYNKSDKQLWLKESRDTYKKISNASIDSLMWNKNYIMGFSQGSYFMVDVVEKKSKLINGRNNFQIINNDYNKLEEVPPLIINKVKTKNRSENVHMPTAP